LQDDFVSAPTRVGLISSEPIRLAGLASVFEHHPGIRVVVGDTDLLLADVSLRYLILDVGHLPGWMEMQLLVRRLRPEIGQIVLGPVGNDELLLRSITAGARAYLDSNSGPLAVRQAVEAVVEGSIWAPRRLLSALIDRLLSQTGAGMHEVAPALSPRERQVLGLITSACSNREIAAELGIEERTVKAYVASLLRKTGAENRVSLSVQAVQGAIRDHRGMRGGMRGGKQEASGRGRRYPMKNS
jgi:DNA-binding NarL/FixJ family response regulator